VSDRHPWRLKLAEKWGGIPIHCDRENTVPAVKRETRGHGVDVAIEAAWGDETVGQAAEMARLGGRVVLVGIPRKDDLLLKHSTARRKGLTIALSRRMKHCYPRAIRLAAQGRVDLPGLVSHRFPLKQVAGAFKLNAVYKDNVVKIIINS
jgi:L-iditol 2-dehydrogenase